MESEGSRMAKYTREFQELFRLKKNVGHYSLHQGLDKTLVYLRRLSGDTTEMIGFSKLRCGELLTKCDGILLQFVIG